MSGVQPIQILVRHQSKLNKTIMSIQLIDKIAPKNDGFRGMVDFYQVIDALIEKSITIENPANDEDITIFFTNKAITITEMRAVLNNGASTPSVTWTIRHATDRVLLVMKL